MTTSSSLELRKALSKYALPNTKELNHLRAADPSSSYRASFFRLQTDELLAAAGRKLSAKATSGLQTLLFQVKEIVHSIQDQQVTQDALQARGLFVRNHIKRKEIVLPFQRPSRLDVVGSYILQTMAYTRAKNMSDYGVLTVDVAVEMPVTCFVAKDFSNYRYFDKRNLYLGVLVSELQRHCDIIQHVTLQTWHGEYEKPVVLLTVAPSFLRQHGLKGVQVRVQLLPVVTTDHFKLAKLVPSRNNVKHEVDMTEQEMEQCGTPLYNNSILEDMMVRQHTKELHSVLKEAPHFAEACILAKVWLRQRGYHKAMDSINGFLLSMLLLYLYQTKRINAQTPSDQMFKVLMQFLAVHELENDPLQFPPAEDGVVLTIEGMQTFCKSYDLVFLDSSGRLNLFGRVTLGAWEEIRQAATESVKLMQNCTLDNFRSLFISKHEFWTQYDQYYWFPAPTPVNDSEDTYTMEEKRSINDIGLEQFWLRKLASVLSRALTDRVSLVRPMSEDSVEWGVNDGSLPMPRKVAIGLRINPDNAWRIVDKGPPADDKVASTDFRHFWKSKSELRRFKDGAIIEAVVWEGISTENRHCVLDAIVNFIVPAHCPQLTTSQIKTSNTALYSVLDIEEPSGSGKANAFNASFESTMNSVSKLWVIFNSFAKTLRAMESLPLKVSDVLPVHPAFRYTSLFPVQPHPLAYSKNEKIDAAPMAHVNTVLEPLVLYVKFERSSAWPNEKSALMFAKTGFYVHIGHELQSRLNLRCEVAKDCVDVLISGYVFRLIIRSEKELSVVTGAAGVKKLALVHSPEYVTVKREADYLLRHASTVHALHTKNTSYGPTVRLVQRWLADKALSNVLSIEAVELLVANVFLTAASTPHSVLSGFLRFLKRVAKFDWQNAPFIVDLTSSLDEDKHREILKRFEASTSSQSTHPAMFIAADYEDMDCLSSWTRFTPDKVVVQRLVSLAQASYDVLVSWLASGASSSGWKTAFASSKMEFDAVLQLATENLPSKRVRVDSSKKHPFVAPVYKNMDMSAVPVMIGFDPVHELLRDLERRYGHFALFFVNGIDTSEILVTWKPQAFLPTKFRAITANYQIPLPNDDAVEDDEPTRCFAIPNIFEILSDMQSLSHGMVISIAMQPFESV
uniref:Nucleolar protein 6 n=1 Tax=Peronospora matthiolae TaxID=2874970 RepID=A0AAV1T2E7_9STRA